MFFSNKQKLLFIAAPKTGSTSVEIKLEELFPEGSRFIIELENGITVTSADVDSPSLGHAKVLEFQRLIGKESFDQLRVMGFVRDPIEKLVSAYFFTRSGSFSDAFKVRTSKRKAPMVLKRLVSIFLARALPLWLWSLIYRMRDCHSYFTDEGGRVIVDYLGSTDRLSVDFDEIMSHLGYIVPGEKAPHTNRSEHRKPEDYWFFRLWIPFYRMRYKRDVELCQLVDEGIWIRGKASKQKSQEV